MTLKNEKRSDFSDTSTLTLCENSKCPYQGTHIFFMSNQATLEYMAGDCKNSTAKNALMFLFLNPFK